MKIIEGKSDKFPYQLTNHFKKVEHLDSFVAPFKRHKEQHRAVICKEADGYAIYTDRREGV